MTDLFKIEGYWYNEYNAKDKPMPVANVLTQAPTTGTP